MRHLNSLQNGPTIYTVDIYFFKTLNNRFIKEDICRGFKPGSRFVASPLSVVAIKGDENNDMHTNTFQNVGQIFQSSLEISNFDNEIWPIPQSATQLFGIS